MTWLRLSVRVIWEKADLGQEMGSLVAEPPGRIHKEGEQMAGAFLACWLTCLLTPRIEKLCAG